MLFVETRATISQESMTHKPALEALVDRIAKNAATINAHCQDKGHPYRSFDKTSPPSLLPSDAPADILSAQRDLFAAAVEIQQLATDANDYLNKQAILVGDLQFNLHLYIMANLQAVPTIQLRKMAMSIPNPSFYSPRGLNLLCRSRGSCQSA